MSFGLALRIALRHLGGRRRQTILSTLGVAVGGAVFSLMVAVTQGQHLFLREKLVDITPHLIVTGERLKPITASYLLDDPRTRRDDSSVVELTMNVPPTYRSDLRPYPAMMEQLEKRKDVIAAVAPYITVQGVARNGTRVETAVLRGVDPEREGRIGRVVRDMQRGSLVMLDKIGNGVILGDGLARKLNIDSGADFRFIVPSGAIQTLRVVGIVKSGVAAFDDQRGYIPLALAQNLRGMGRDAAGGLSIQVQDLEKVEAVKPLAEEVTGHRAETWEESNAQILGFQERQQTTARLLVVFVFLTAAFGIANTLVTVVLQKRTDIAVMKGFGMSRGGIAGVFLLEGAIIGIMGGVLAGALGYGMANYFGTLNLLRGNERALLRFETFPVALDPIIFIGTAVLSIVMAMLAAVAPARRAARAVPVEIIRGE